MAFTSREFYREIKTGLKTLMKDNGFRTAKGMPLGWTRPVDGGSSTVMFQCDKWGWNPLWGSRFTVEFGYEVEPGNPTTSRRRGERLGYLLEGFEELDDLRVRNNEVIESLPGTIKGLPEITTVPGFAPFVSTGYKVDEERAVIGRDLWLNYFSKEDARNWAEYFRGKMLFFLDVFETGTRSDIGLARVRYNELMSEVQRSVGLNEKTRLLRDFLGREASTPFRSEVERWLAAVDGESRH